MKPFIIDGRPTQELFFTADQRTLVRIDSQGLVDEAPDDDPADLHSADMETLPGNASVQEALGLALAFAQTQGWELDADTVYFH